MPLRISTLILTVGVLIGASSSSCLGQELVIQQPVVETFTIGTTVVVPDRGSTLLGSVSRAADARNTAGFSRLGSSIGSERSRSSARVHIYIHDFESMDQALLNAGRAQVQYDARPKNPLAERAYLSLMNRDLNRQSIPAAISLVRATNSLHKQSTLSASDEFNAALQTRSLRRTRVFE